MDFGMKWTTSLLLVHDMFSHVNGKVKPIVVRQIEKTFKPKVLAAELV